MTTRRRRACALLLVVAGCLACDGLSKEQRARIGAVKEAISRDPTRIDAPWEQGLPPLHVALLERSPSLLAWLLERGAAVNVRDAQGMTALHCSVFLDDAQGRSFLRTLAGAGADPNAARDDGTTPLHTAAAFGSAATVAVLLELGADPLAATIRGETPLHLAATPQPQRSPEECQRVVAQLVGHGAPVDATDHFGRTPLLMAALVGHAVVAQALLAAGADPSGAGGGLPTPVEVAVLGGHDEVADLLRAAHATQRR